MYLWFKVQYLTKISIFGYDFIFYEKLRPWEKILTKMSIFEQKFDL